MKNALFVLAGIAAAAAAILITRTRSPRSVDDLAHDLQSAWADHTPSPSRAVVCAAGEFRPRNSTAASLARSLALQAAPL